MSGDLLYCERTLKSQATYSTVRERSTLRRLALLRENTQVSGKDEVRKQRNFLAKQRDTAAKTAESACSSDNVARMMHLHVAYQEHNSIFESTNSSIEYDEMIVIYIMYIEVNSVQ